MNVESWQAGLFLGTAFTLLVDFGVRALLWRLRIRKRKLCGHCTGILGDDGRAEFPVERLECCAWCGDTWAEGKRPEYEAPVIGYRDSAEDQLLALVRDLPAAPKLGDLVNLDEAFERLQKTPDWSSDPELRALQQLTHHLAPVPTRPVPGSGKQRYGFGLQYGHRPNRAMDIVPLSELKPSGTAVVRPKPPPDLPAELPPPRRVSECVALPLPRPPKRVLG